MHQKLDQSETNSLVQNYKPVALKAVAAALTVKPVEDKSNNGEGVMSGTGTLKRFKTAETD